MILQNADGGKIPVHGSSKPRTSTRAVGEPTSLSRNAAEKGGEGELCGKASLKQHVKGKHDHYGNVDARRQMELSGGIRSAYGICILLVFARCMHGICEFHKTDGEKCRS